MRILHATHDFLPRHQAGAEIYVYHLCRELSRAHQVSVLCADYDLAAAHGSVRHRSHGGLPVHELINNWSEPSLSGTYRSRRLNGQLWRLLGEVAPDVLHVHNLTTLSLDLPALARMRSVPCVATLHDYSLVCPAGGQLIRGGEGQICQGPEPARCARCYAGSPLGTLAGLGRRRVARAARLVKRFAPPAAVGKLWQALRAVPAPAVTAAQMSRRLGYLRRVTEAVDLFLAPSAAMAEFFARQGIPEEKLRVSDYGMALLSPVPRSPLRDPSSARRVRLGFVGTLAWHKGAHLLLDALARLDEQDLELEIFGDPNTWPHYVDRLQAAARDRRLPVRFMGPFPCEEAARTYARMDALVVPSLWPENSPLVIHEAFQAGVPVVAARAGGIPTLVGKGGLLFEPGDVEDLARKMEELARPGRLAELVEGIPLVKTVEENARELVGVYEELVERESNECRKQVAQREVLSRQNAERGARTAELRDNTSTEDECAETETPSSEFRVPSSASISVMLVTRDGMATLPALLDALERQEMDAEVEIVAVDSGSTDGTAELLGRRADRLIQVRPEQFDHGLTRNLGLEHCSGELVVLLVQDALPASDHLLAELCAPLWQDPGLAGTHARQLPRPDAGPLTRSYARGWLSSGARPRVATIADAEALARLSPSEQYRLCCFDNVCSCVRRSVWRQMPFRRTPFAEDLEWAKAVLSAGHRLAYVPGAAVIHSHERSAGYEFRRTYLAHQRLRALFGLRTVPTPVHLALAVAGTMGSHARCLARQPGRGGLDEVKRAVALSLALPLGQYLGALSSDTGRQWIQTGGLV